MTDKKGAPSPRPARRAGGEVFDAFYEGRFGARWYSLREALLDEPRYVRLSYGFEPYYLDAASFVCALCLPVAGQESVLDLCAAPGGKSLVLLGCMDESSVLFSNDISRERERRMERVFKECLGDSYPKKVKCSVSNGALWCKAQSRPRYKGAGAPRGEQKARGRPDIRPFAEEPPAEYDSILLDAPCGTERKVLKNAKSTKNALEKWSAGRIRSERRTEDALLGSAARILCPGGFLLYSTCSLCKEENDGAVARILKRFPDMTARGPQDIESIFVKNSLLIQKRARVECDIDIERIFRAREECEYGFWILPDRAERAGPIYCCLLQKRAKASKP